MHNDLRKTDVDLVSIISGTQNSFPANDNKHLQIIEYTLQNEHMHEIYSKELRLYFKYYV